MQEIRTERLGLTLNRHEKIAVKRLAEIEGGLSLSALMRRLIRRAAIERDLWPSTSTPQMETTNEPRR